MFFREDSRRPMNISREEYDKKCNELYVKYCAGCAVKYGLPNPARGAVNQQVETCSLCGLENPIVSYVMRDNPLIDRKPKT